MRFLARFALTAFAAIIFCVLVAMSASIWPIRTSSYELSVAESIEPYNEAASHLGWIPERAELSKYVIRCVLHNGPGFTHAEFFGSRRDAPEPTATGAVQWTTWSSATATTLGWPLRCFVADQLEFVGATGPPLSFAEKLQLLVQRTHILPFPLLGNVAIFMAAFSVTASGLRAWRAANRRKRRLCVNCGYPRGSSSTCSECGAALPSRDAGGRSA